MVGRYFYLGYDDPTWELLVIETDSSLMSDVTAKLWRFNCTE